MTFWEWLGITYVTGDVYADIFGPDGVSVFAEDRRASDVTHTGVYLKRLAELTFAELRPWADYRVESAEYLGTVKEWCSSDKYADEEDMVILEIHLKKPERK